MILELASFLGTSVGGKLFGIISDSMSERRQAERDKRKFEHEANLASRDQLKAHVSMLNAMDGKGHYSPLGWVVAGCVGLFCLTYCTATLSCFIVDPTAIVYSKDPTAEVATRSILFGTIKWDIANNKILAMSKLGAGILLTYPVIFILSMVVTGDRPRGR